MEPSGGVPISPITGVPGWETESEERFLLALAQTVRDGGVIVELGSEYGRSAAVFCHGAQTNTRIYSFDLFPVNHPQVGDLLEAYKANLTEAGYKARTIVVRYDSSRAGQKWDRGAVDLLFVDADHSYEGVKRDIEAWTLHVAIGGHIAFHDCAHGDNPHVLHLEISRAVDEWLDVHKWKELPQVDSIRTFRRMA